MKLSARLLNTCNCRID